MMRISLASTPRRHFSGFTLVEMLVAISILLILTVITFAVVNVTMDADRIRTGARQVQSYLEGARDRAIYTATTDNPGPRGVRFLLDPNGPTDAAGRPRTGNSMVYIGPPSKHREGLIQIGPDKRTVAPNSEARWPQLQNRGLLVDGARIRIRPRAGAAYTTPYTIAWDEQSGSDGNWKLTRDYVGNPPPNPVEYELELAPAVLPNQEPRPLPRGIMIDLNPQNSSNPTPNNTRLPSSWIANQNRLDVLFSPRGTVTGQAASAGIIHLLLADVADLEQGRIIGNPNKEGDEVIITIATQTGNISTSAVAPGADPYAFAERGEVAR